MVYTYRVNLEKLYKNIYLNIKRKAKNLGVNESKELIQYRKNQERLSKRPIKVSTETEMLKASLKSDIIFLGDFHTFDQSTKNLERLIRYFAEKKVSFAIGLELINSNHQLYIDSYLKGALSDLEFLECIHYHESWRFPWNHYRKIFEWAKKYRIPILGLNSEGSLHARDVHAANKIQNHLKLNQNQKMLVLFGEYHLCPNKLPKLLTHHKSVIIQQNNENLFFRIQKLKKDGTVTKISKNEFHLQTSPPWIKYESYVYWYEHLLEDEDFDLHRYIIETGLKSYQANYLEQFKLIFDAINKNLNLGLDNNLIDQIELWDQTQLLKIKKLILKIKDKKIQAYFHFLLSEHQTFIIPETNIIYCPNYSLNRLSYAAGLFLFELILTRQNTLNRIQFLHKNNSSTSLFLVRQSFMGFLVSKIINPMRKCDLYADLSDQNKLHQKCKETIDRKKIFKGRNLKETHLLAKFVGHFLAHNYFLKFEKNLEKELKNLEYYLYFSSKAEEDYSHLVQNILKSQNYKNQKKKRF